MFKVKAEPTFWFTCEIPVAGEDDQVLELQGKRMRRDDLANFDQMVAGRTFDDVILEYITGWRNVDTEFSEQALRDMLQEYPCAARAIVEKYAREQMEAKRKNS